MIREIFGKPIMTVIKPDEKVIKSPRKKNLVTLTCDCGCGETFDKDLAMPKRTSSISKTALIVPGGSGIQNKGGKKKGGEKQTVRTADRETCDVGAVPKTPEPSLDESVKLPIPEEDKEQSKCLRLAYRRLREG